MTELPKARITTIEKVYYQKHEAGAQPTLIEAGHLDPIESDEQPYVRHLPLPFGEFKKIEYGWIKEPGLVHIKNKGGSAGFFLPTEEERKRLASLVVEIILGEIGSNSQAMIEIPPGRSIRFYVKSQTIIWARCQSGDTQLEINVFPR